MFCTLERRRVYDGKEGMVGFTGDSGSVDGRPGWEKRVLVVKFMAR